MNKIKKIETELNYARIERERDNYRRVAQTHQATIDTLKADNEKMCVQLDHHIKSNQSLLTLLLRLTR